MIQNKIEIEIFTTTQHLDGLQCFSCDSSVNENCATLKLNTTDKECDGNCATWVDGTATLRGCESDVPQGTQLSANCTTNGCNIFILPDERIKCVKCSADDELCVSPTADFLYPCKNYVAEDSCYTYVIDETSAVRGCLSDQDSNVDLCNSVGEVCIKCTEEVCNLHGGKSYVSCVTCSSDDNESCGYLQEDSADKILCSELLGRENLCFAYGNQTSFLRGCLNDFPKLKEICSENSEVCQICDEDECNVMKIVEEFCYVCDSLTDPDCENVAENLTPTLCGEGTISKSGCYLSEKGKSNTNLLGRSANNAHLISYILACDL